MELPRAAKFCLQCGQAVAKPSPDVTVRDPRAYTPKPLTEKILQSKSALEGERKQVTVLFADVKGSMDLGEQVDPEEWIGRVYLRLGSYEEAVTSLERPCEIAHESHVGFEIEPFASGFLAEAYAHSGAPDRALRTAEEAVLGARQCTVGLLPSVLLQFARTHLRTKGLASRAAIEAALDEASRLVRRSEFKLLEPFIHVERAELARLSGDEATRQRELREAHRLFTEIGAPIRAEQVAKELAG